VQQRLLQQKLKIKKSKLLRSNPYRISAIKLQGLSSTEVLIEDEDILVNSRRIVLRVENSLHEDEEVSDYVRLRLILARETAMLKYREIYDKA